MSEKAPTTEIMEKPLPQIVTAPGFAPTQEQSNFVNETVAESLGQVPLEKANWVDVASQGAPVTQEQPKPDSNKL